jgi:hypothetical protein
MHGSVRLLFSFRNLFLYCLKERDHDDDSGNKGSGNDEGFGEDEEPEPDCTLQEEVKVNHLPTIFGLVLNMFHQAVCEIIFSTK